VPYNPDTGACSPSPILINFENAGNNDHLTAERVGVWFDLNATGTPVHTAWTSAESRVGFLVRDLDGNGAIDSGAELFGTATIKRDGTRAQNGFEALRDVDDNRDGRLDRKDMVYGQLRVWFDLNHNGRSERSELFTLQDLEVMEIRTF